MDIQGLRIVITGAGQGLGGALALALGRRGARVALVARTEAALEAVAREVASAGGEAHAVPGDLGDKRAIHRIAGQAMAALGGVDVLVHGASTLGHVPLRALADTDCEALERALAVNVLGPFRLTKALLGPMLVAGRGLVLLVSSDAAVEAYPTWGAYGASKAALDQLGRVWSAELEESGVRVVTVDPGEMDTAMHADAMPDADRSTLTSPAQVAERFVDIIARAETITPGHRVQAQRFVARGAPVNAVPARLYRDETLAPATASRGDPLDERLLVIDPSAEALVDARVADLPRFLREGDLLVVNDSATLPASLRAEGPTGEAMELRLAHRRDDGAWDVVLFGAGDWRTRTERRAAPPVVTVGDALSCGDDFSAVVEALSSRSPRLATVRFSRDGDAFWRRLYQHGRPVQYAHLRGDLALWDVQTPFASRPWSMEMPSAGRPLAWGLVQALRDPGVAVAALTHAAGLSSTGDEALDAQLPWPERSDIPASTVDAVARCRRRGGRVVAVGTSVVRALEGRAARSGGALTAGTAMTDLVLGEGSALRVVDGVFTGMHEPGTSHFALLTAFASAELLHASLRFAASREYLQHEFGDSALVLAGSSRR